MNSLGLLKKINFDLQEIGSPIPFKWGKCKLATASFGHGITTTPLQLAKAYAILTNGGYEIVPSIFKKNFKKTIRKKVVSSKTSEEINTMLRKVVSLEEGTANFANPKISETVIKNLHKWCKDNGVQNLKEIIGIAQRS